MKMEHVVEAATPGRIDAVAVAPGDAVQTGDVLTLRIAERPAPHHCGRDAVRRHLREADAAVRPELVEVRERVAATLDAGRPEATGAGRRAAAAPHARTSRTCATPTASRSTAALVIAAQRARRGTEDLIAHTPADGLIAGIGPRQR